MSDLTLDELFAVAKAEYGKMRNAKPAAPAPTPVPRWKRGQNIRLLHKGTDAFLGDFSEWLARDGARRLVREEDNTLPIEKIEWIEGDWGVNTPEVAKRPCVSGHTITVFLELESIPTLLGKADITVFLELGGIASAELLTTTTFSDGAGEILELPPSFNVFPLLTRTSKCLVFGKVRQQQEQ